MILKLSGVPRELVGLDATFLAMEEPYRQNCMLMKHQQCFVCGLVVSNDMWGVDNVIPHIHWANEECFMHYHMIVPFLHNDVGAVLNSTNKLMIQMENTICIHHLGWWAEIYNSDLVIHDKHGTNGFNRGAYLSLTPEEVYSLTKRQQTLRQALTEFNQAVLSNMQFKWRRVHLDRVYRFRHDEAFRNRVRQMNSKSVDDSDDDYSQRHHYRC